MTREVMRYKLNELRMMLNDGEHGEEQGILVDIIKELDSAENKGDLISKEKVKDIVRSGISTDTEADKEYVYGLIDSIPSADVRPNIHGHWKRRTYIGNHETVTMNVCSECGKEFGWDVETGIAISDNNFCPNCGADMRGVSK